MTRIADREDSSGQVAELVVAAGRDLVEFQNSDLPASALAEFVSRYFPRLHAQPIGQDLQVVNDLGETQIIRRLPVEGHRGAIQWAGTQHFQTSALVQLLEAGQGIERDFRQLVEHLARFNNRSA